MHNILHIYTHLYTHIAPSTEVLVLYLQVSCTFPQFCIYTHSMGIDHRLYWELTFFIPSPALLSSMILPKLPIWWEAWTRETWIFLEDISTKNFPLKINIEPLIIWVIHLKPNLHHLFWLRTCSFSRGVPSRELTDIAPEGVRHPKKVGTRKSKA